MYISEYETKIGDSPKSQSSLSFSQACQDLVRTKNARKKIRERKYGALKYRGSNGTVTVIAPA